jgi:hypothetical protein
MLALDSAKIKDFRLCERLYDYRHVQGLPETTSARDILSLRFENTLKSIVNFYFYKKQTGIPPSYSSILNRWQKLWFPKNTTAYDIIHEKHESHYGNSASLTTKAADVLLKLVDNFSDPEIIPIAIDDDFIVPINQKVYLEDGFNLVYSYKNNIFVLKWAFNIRSKELLMEDTKTISELVAMHTAFKSKYGNKIDSAKFGYYDLLNPKPQFIECEITKDHINAVNYWVTEIEKEEVFPSKRGLITYCKSCPFNKPCSKWKNWSTKEA